MIVAYFDTSAFVKLFIEEMGSDDAATLWDAADIVCSSRVIVPEVGAALAAAHRSGRLDADSYQGATDESRRYIAAIRKVEMTEEIAEDAAALAARHALSGLDAVHLASAHLLSGSELVLATWDRRLHSAAVELGLATLPAALN